MEIKTSAIDSLMKGMGHAKMAHIKFKNY